MSKFLNRLLCVTFHKIPCRFAETAGLAVTLIYLCDHKTIHLNFMDKGMTDNYINLNDVVLCHIRARKTTKIILQNKFSILLFNQPVLFNNSFSSEAKNIHYIIITFFSSF